MINLNISKNKTLKMKEQRLITIINNTPTNNRNKILMNKKEDNNLVYYRINIDHQIKSYKKNKFKTVLTGKKYNEYNHRYIK